MKCIHCGHESDTEVRECFRYIGGQGYVGVPLCDDVEACDARWDELNGFHDGVRVKVTPFVEVR